MTLGIKKKKKEKTILAGAGLLRGRTLAVEAKSLQREHVCLPRSLELRSPTLPSTAGEGRGSREAVPGLGEGGRGHTRCSHGAGAEWKANTLPELPRAPHCPVDAPDRARGNSGEQLACSSSKAKAWPPRVYVARVRVCAYIYIYIHTHTHTHIYAPHSIAESKLQPANGSPVCWGPCQQRHECRKKKSPPVSRGVRGLASVGTQFPKHAPNKVLER